MNRAGAEVRTHHEGVKYRPDIDGLRALAIIPVVWFHSNLPGLPGGFTGVDTFFVISGYLITLIIHREVSAGSYSFTRFYERRARRIAPALLLVLLATTVAGFALLLPYELQAYSKSGSAALAMVGNVYFWRVGGYFALADSVTPLLHTWSLGVEEQFYLLFPACLLLAERFRLTKPAIGTLFVGSLLLCLLITARSPAAAFYLIPTRGWELMAGAALAVRLVTIPASGKPYLGVAGLALILAASIVIDSDSSFPGWRALIPALGAVLVIGSGPGGLAGRILSARPLVYVGRISYSLYLWHWPVFAFLRHWRADPQLPPVYSLLGIGLAFAFAAASYKYVEQPARSRAMPIRRLLLMCGATASILIFAFTIAIAGRGLPQRLPKHVTQLAALHDAYAPLARACTDIGFEEAMRRCHIGAQGAPRFVLWGDSHASAISEAVGLGVKVPGVVLSIGACAPTAGWIDPKLKGRDPETCRAFNHEALKMIERDVLVRTVVLSAYWNSHERAGGTAFWASVQQLVDRLNRDRKRVVVIAGIPEPGADVPWASAIRARFARPPLKITCKPARIPLRNVTVVDVSKGFCRRDPAGLFTDSNHISRLAGTEIIAPAIKHAFISR